MRFSLSQLAVAVSAASLANAAFAQQDVLEEVLVYGQLSATKSAIQQQRDARGVSSVLDLEKVGNFPDQNMAEAIGRLSGVGIVLDQGEGRYITVRGLGENYNQVQINGANLPTPEDNSRALPLDVLPNDIIASVEITKTLLPENDANSLGGNIDIKSLSAFDRSGATFRVTGEGYYNALNEQWSPKAGVTATNTFALGDASEDNFGIAFTASFFDRELANDNSETGGGWSADDDGNVLGTTDLEQRDYVVTRDRIGLGLNLDYILNDSTSLYLRNLYSEFGDEETRNATIIEWDDPQLQGAAPGAATVQKEGKYREETQTISSTLFGGQTQSGNWLFEYQAGYSTASEEQALSIDGGPVFEFDGDIELGIAGVQSLRVIAPAAFDDPASYELDEVELVTVDYDDEVVSFQFDASRELTLFGADSELKLGFKTNLREKTTEEEVFESDGGDLESNFAAWSSSVDYTIDPAISIGVNGPAFSRAILAQSASFERVLDDSVLADTNIEENIYAGYLQLTQQLGDLSLTYGVRVESTEVDANGFEFFENEETEEVTVTATQTSNDYSNVFPSLTAKWQPTDDWVVRGAVGTSMARPTFEQIAPGASRTDNPGDDEFSIATGNANLDPLRAVNFDLMAEYYPNANGVLSAGLFYKDISDFIYEAEIDGASIGFDGFEVETFLNADEAYIAGVEFNAVYTWNSGFLVNANLTFVDAETTIEFDGGERDIMLPNQAEAVGNLTVGYENDWLSLRAAVNYRSKAFIEAGDLEDPFEDVYEDDRTNVQLSGYVNATDDLQLFVKVQNLTDEPYYAYQSRRNLNVQYETYDVAYYFGFEYSNF